MPIHIREYFFLIPNIFLATWLFVATCKNPIFFRWGMLWFAIWTIVYLLKSIYIVGILLFFLGIFLLRKARSERIAYYFATLSVLPLFVSVEMPGLIPGIRAWIDLNVPVMLAFFVLLPITIKGLFFGAGRDGLFTLKTDKYMAALIVLLCILCFRAPSLTASLRGVTLVLIHYFLPYYAISRSLKKREDFELVLYAFAFSGMIVASVGILEAFKRWPMFVTLVDTMNLRDAPISPFVVRGGFLKIGSTWASGTPVGYFLDVVIAILFFLKNYSRLNKRLLYLIAAMCVTTIFLTTARGAWLGFLVMAVLIAMYQKGKKLKIVFAVVLALYVGFPFLEWTPVGQAITRKLGEVVPTSTEHEEYGSIEYRQKLIDASFYTMSLHPWFGSLDYWNVPEMEAMRQGEGIIDVVNTYLKFGLDYGWVGLTLFALVFASETLSLFILANSRRFRRQNEYFSQMTAIFFAILVTTIVVIGTVSSVSLLPHYYWALVGFSAALIRVVGDLKKQGEALKAI